MTQTRSHHRPPVHPGEILREEFLTPLGLSQVKAAARMRMPAKRLNEIVCERRGVTADSALQLAKLTKTTPQFWLNLQNAVDLYHAQRRLRRTA